MNERISFGVVGGYGATGQAVVSELSKSGTDHILIGGPNLARGSALASKYDGQASATRVDVLDTSSVDEFCRQCSIVVNCAGPVKALRDRVAQAAFRQHCHYIDPAGMRFVAEGMRSKSDEIADLGLSFIVSAGWMPGISEVVSVYAHALAKRQMDTVESVTVYYGDSGEWSANALRDGVWYLRQLGGGSPSYFHKGRRVRLSRSAVLSTTNLGKPIGIRRFGMFFTPELNEIGGKLDDCEVRAYSYVSGFRAILASTAIALLPIPEGLSVRLLRNVFRRNQELPVGGFVVARAIGHSQRRPMTLTVQIVYEAGRDYWVHGLAIATAARMVAEGKGVQKGVHFLADAVDAQSFLKRLKADGVEHTESVEPYE
jgi:hypothetical protein